MFPASNHHRASLVIIVVKKTFADTFGHNKVKTQRRRKLNRFFLIQFTLIWMLCSFNTRSTDLHCCLKNSLCAIYQPNRIVVGMHTIELNCRRTQTSQPASQPANPPKQSLCVYWALYGTIMLTLLGRWERAFFFPTFCFKVIVLSLGLIWVLCNYEAFSRLKMFMGATNTHTTYTTYTTQTNAQCFVPIVDCGVLSHTVTPSPSLFLFLSRRLA